MPKSVPRARRSKPTATSRRIETIGWFCLLLLPILAVAAGAFLLLRRRLVVGATQLIAALIISSRFAGLIPLILSWI